METTKQSDAEPSDPMLRVLLEVARRANWDALHGSRHLRTGRFRPEDAYRDLQRRGLIKEGEMEPGEPQP